MRDSEISRQTLTHNSEKLNFFLVAQQLRDMVDLEPYEFQTRRGNPRTTRSLSVSLQPLDDDFQPCGNMFWVVSRDISPKGMGLICHDRLNCQYVRSGLMNEHVTVISRVCHNTSIGEKYPLFLVGIEFLNQLEMG